jgi:hypothetical protein
MDEQEYHFSPLRPLRFKNNRKEFRQVGTKAKVVNANVKPGKIKRRNTK